MKKLFQFFIRRKEPSGTGFSLTVPGLSRAGESPFLRWLVQFAILSLGMLGCAVSFLSGFRLTFDSAVPVWICLYSAAAVTVYSTAAWALWILIPGIPLVLWAFFFFDQLSIGLVSLINRIFVVMSLNSPWSFPTYVLPETEATLSEIRWMETWFLVLFFCTLTLIVGYFVVRRTMVPVVILLTAPLALWPMYFTLSPELWAFFALLLSWLMLFAGNSPFRSRDLFGKKIRKRPAMYRGNVRRQLSLLMALCMLVSIVTAMAVLPQQGYQRPADIDILKEQITRLPQNLFDFFTGGGAEKNLHNLGTLRFSGETALEVLSTEKNPQTLYLRGYAANSYNGNGWNIEDDGAYQQASSQFTRYQGAYLNPMNYYDLLSDNDRSYILQIRNVATAHDSIYVPSYLKTDPSTISGVGFRQDLFAQRGWTSPSEYSLEAFVQPDSWNCLFHAPLVGETIDRVPDEFQKQNTNELLQVTSAYAAYIYEPYTRLPENTRRAALEWCSQYNIESYTNAINFEGYNSRTVAIENLCRQIQEIFRQEYRYSYSPPPFPQGSEFIQWFTENKIGYCVHYATAGALLLRALGVPARYAEGYIITTDDWENGQRTEDGYLQVPDSHSHAWVEVYDVDDGVWVPVEMTPGFHEDDFWESPSQSGTTSVKPTPTPEQTPEPEETPEASPTPEATETPAPTEIPGGADGPDQTEIKPVPQWMGILFMSLWIAIGVVLLLLALVLRRKWLLGRWRKRWRQKNVREAVRAYWEWSFRFIRNTGGPELVNGCLTREYVEAMKQQYPHLKEELLMLAYETGEKARFAQQEPDENDRQLMSQWTRHLQKCGETGLGFWKKQWLRWKQCLI